MELSDRNEIYANVEKRRGLTQSALCKGLADSNANPLDLMRIRCARNSHLPALEKAVSGILTTDTGWTALRPLQTAWADLVRRITVLGRVAPFVRQIDALVPVSTVDTGVTAAFVTENTGTPIARPSFTVDTLQPGKLAIAGVYSKELARVSGDKAAILIERDQSRAIALAEDGALLDSGAAVAGGRPASIFHGLSAIDTGSPSAILDDVLALPAALRGGFPVSPYYVTNPAGARYLIAAVDLTSGVRLFPNVTLFGGDIFGVPLLVSAGCPDILGIFDADAIFVVDEQVEVDAIFQAALQFSGTPSSSAAASISLFQSGMLAVKTTRYIGWRLAWPDGAAFITLPIVGSPA